MTMSVDKIQRTQGSRYMGVVNELLVSFSLIHMLLVVVGCVIIAADT